MLWTPGRDAASADYWITKRHPENCGSVGPAAVPALLDALKEPALIPGAIDALGDIGDTSAGWPLLEVARDLKYKPHVIKAIIKWKENALPLLYKAMKEGDPAIRQVAVSVLDLLAWRPTANETGAWYWALKNNLEKCIQIGPAAVGPLLGLLDQKEKDIQGEIIKTLGVIGDESALNGLMGLLNTADNERRKTILEALGDFKQPETVDVLVQALADKNLAITAAQSLVQVGYPAVAALARILVAPDRKLRLRAAETLEKMKWKPESDGQWTLFWIARQDWKKCVELGVGAVEMLIGELGQEDTCVEATRALIEIGDTRAVKPIIQALAGKSSFVQREMAEILGSLGADPDGALSEGDQRRTEVVESLLAELNQGTVELVPIIQALGETQDERGARPLTEYLKNSYPVSIREAAAQALGKIGLPAVDLIFEVMKGEGIDPRAAGVALGGVGPDAQKLLIAALKSKTYDAQVLVYALGKIGDEASARAILDTLVGTQYGQEIQNTAQEALFEIGAPSIKPIIEGYARHPEAEAVLTSLLFHYGVMAVEPLVWALGNTLYTKQVESIIYVLGEIGDVRASNPLINMLKRNNVNARLVNEALEKIRTRQRAEKERTG
jgi:HEAT repeat protein